MATSLLDPEVPMEKVVTEAHKAFWHCRASAEQPDWSDFPSLCLHCAMIHMAHGVKSTLATQHVIPSFPLLRTMLESWFSIAYIHQADYEQRSLCWLCAYTHQGIGLKEYLDPNSNKGKEFRRILALEFPDLDYPLPKDDQWLNTRDELIEQLNRPSMKPIEDEFQRLKEAHPRKVPPKWHKMFGGPSNMRQLAGRIQREFDYITLYGQWSEVVHGVAAPVFASMQKDDSAEFRSPYDPSPHEMIVEVDFYTRYILVKGTELMMKKFVGERQ